MTSNRRILTAADCAEIEKRASARCSRRDAACLCPIGASARAWCGYPMDLCDSEDLAAAVATIAAMREALGNLQKAEAAYRLAHDSRGDGDITAGRAWDLMRRAGDAARVLSPPPGQMEKS